MPAPVRLASSGRAKESFWRDFSRAGKKPRLNGLQIGQAPGNDYRHFPSRKMRD